MAEIKEGQRSTVRIDIAGLGMFSAPNGILEGDLYIPNKAQSIVLFAHGAGSTKYSLRNQYVAHLLNNVGIATLLVDLLTREEKQVDSNTRSLRFDIGLLADRIEIITSWLIQNPETSKLYIGYFGSSTGSAAAFIAASQTNVVKAIVSRGGRPDLAGSRVLQNIQCPTLLIVGGEDETVVKLNRLAFREFVNIKNKELVIIPGASHLFVEPGKMEDVAHAAVEWFECYLLKKAKIFENKHTPRGSGLSSHFRGRSKIQIRFKDRTSAGEMLASLLTKYKGENAIVIGIPRGGAIVASVVATKLAIDFDIVIPKKIMVPGDSENAIGAIMHDGSSYIDTNLVESMGVSNEYIEKEKLEQLKEIERRMALYRPFNREYKIKDKVVILVDDGIATGSTIIAAARWIRKQEPRLLVVAAPVAPQQATILLRAESDHVEVITSPKTSRFKTVENFYHDFSPVNDWKVIEIVSRMVKRP